MSTLKTWTIVVILLLPLHLVSDDWATFLNVLLSQLNNPPSQNWKAVHDEKLGPFGQVGHQWRTTNPIDLKTVSALQERAKFEWYKQPQFPLATDFCDGVAIAQTIDGNWKFLQLNPTDEDAVLTESGVFKVAKSNPDPAYFEQLFGPLETYRVCSCEGLEGQIESGLLYRWESGRSNMNCHERFCGTTLNFKDGTNVSYLRFENYHAVERGGKWGFIDSALNQVIPFRFDEVRDFSEGKCFVKIEEHYHCIDKKGNYVFYEKFDWAMEFKEELAVVRKSDKYGAVNEAGEWVIPPTYKCLSSFSNGLAEFRSSEGFWGYLDQTEKVVIEPQFYDAKPFSDGVAGVMTLEARYGLINKQGEFLLPPTFKDVGQFNDGLIPVLEGDLWGYLHYQQE